jgi:hypothetical protein
MADIAPGHGGAEISEFFGLLRRAGIMRADPAVFRGETKSKSNPKIFERSHLSIKPSEGVRTKRICPADPGAEMPDS